jgi:protein TonB
MNALFDWRKPGPLLTVVLLHVALFHALQAGLMQKAADSGLVREVVATLLKPEPPPPPKIELPKPLPMAKALPPPQPPVAPPEPQPAIVAPVNPTPSPTAITLPPAPAVPTPAPITVAPAPAPAPSTPAPVAAAEPAPISPPRFDAAYLNNPPPAYPTLSRRSGEQGKVMLRVRVTEEGRAAEVDVKTSSGSARLDEAAQAAVRQWRFVPAKQGDVAVGAWVLVPLVFKLDS